MTLKVKVNGVLAHNINPLLDEVKKMKEDFREIYEKRLKKRSVSVTVTDYHK